MMGHYNTRFGIWRCIVNQKDFYLFINICMHVIFVCVCGLYHYFYYYFVFVCVLYRSVVQGHVMQFRPVGGPDTA